MALEIRAIPTLTGISAEVFVAAAKKAEELAKSRGASKDNKRHERVLTVLRKAKMF